MKMELLSCISSEILSKNSYVLNIELHEQVLLYT